MGGDAVERGEALELLGQEGKVDPRHLRQAHRDLLEAAALALLSAGKEGAFGLTQQDAIDDETTHRELEGG
jgi:hypothetical protein